VSSPILIIAASSGSTLVAQLHQHGWHPYGSELEEVDGEIQITLDQLVVIVGDRIAFRDAANPLSPPGWWEAVDLIKGRCIVVFVPAGTAVGDPSFGDVLRDLIDDPATAQALLRVEHPA